MCVGSTHSHVACAWCHGWHSKEGSSWIADLLFIQKCDTRGWVGSVVVGMPVLHVVHSQARDLTTLPSRFCRHWCKLRIKRSSRCRAELKTAKTYTGGVGVQRRQPRHLAMPLHSRSGIEHCIYCYSYVSKAAGDADKAVGAVTKCFVGQFDAQQCNPVAFGKMLTFAVVLTALKLFCGLYRLPEGLKAMRHPSTASRFG